MTKAHILYHEATVVFFAVSDPGICIALPTVQKLQTFCTIQKFRQLLAR
jgi:hypothetical protein